MGRLLGTGVAAVAALAVLAHAALADEQGATGYDGKNPFACTLQELGQGTNFPEPNADPFCVEYDKRHQNVDKLGVVDFLSKEPARVAAASNKCFYFQRDHWRGYVSESQPSTKTYAWDGSYYFDKARGMGGAYVENFSFAGQTGDPTTLPGFPDQYRPYFSTGRGGVQKSGAVAVDPNCVKKFHEHDPRAGGGPAGADQSNCRLPGGRVGHGIGGIRLGARRTSVRKALGPPTLESTRYVSYCMAGGGRIAAGFGSAGSAGKVLLVTTNSAPFAARGIHAGSKTSDARAAFHGMRLVKAHGLRLLWKGKHGYTLVFGVARGRVRFAAISRPGLSPKRVAQLIRGAPR